MRPDLVITGFEPFAEHRENSSASLVLRLLEQSRADVHLEVLPTAYGRAGARIEAIIDSLRPRALLMLGLAAASRAVRLEQRAENRDEAELLDNDGECRLGVPIVCGAPDSYASTLPLERFAARVRAANCPVEFSPSAGRFVCNHVFYRAQHRIASTNLQISCGFVHVPPAPEQHLEPWLAGVQACIEVLRCEFGSGAEAATLKPSPRSRPVLR